MLRLADTDPLALQLFSPKDLKGLRHLKRVKRGRREGKIADDEQMALDFESSDLPDFEREHLFALAIGRRWRFDFAWPAYRVAVEYEGLVVRRIGGELIVTGRHATVTGMREDMVKYNAAAMQGWAVFRFDRDLVRAKEHVRTIREALLLRGWKPTWNEPSSVSNPSMEPELA